MARLLYFVDGFLLARRTHTGYIFVNSNFLERAWNEYRAR